MLAYHSVKKEIRFFGKFKGEFVEIPYEECPRLEQYSPGTGDFVLQNQGKKFFDDIWEQFAKDNINITFKGTKIDYQDMTEELFQQFQLQLLYFYSSPTELLHEESDNL